MATAPEDDVAVALRGCLRAVRAAVRCAEGVAMAMDPDVLVPTQFAATFQIRPEFAAMACRNEQREDDVLKFRELADRPTPVAALSADRDEACRASRRWQEALLPRGRRHELRAALVDGRGACWGALAAYRHDGAPFSPADVAAVHRLGPELAVGIARATVTTRAPGTPSSPTSLLIDSDGVVVAAPSAARQWLALVRAGDELDRVGMSLAALAGLVARRRADGEDEAVRLRLRSAGGSWTTLVAETMRLPGGGEVIPVVVMPTDRTQLLPLQMAAFGLSEREADVVVAVLDGLDTKAVSRRLSISALTVQDHLKSVFAKVGVRSRRELVSLLGIEPR